MTDKTCFNKFVGAIMRMYRRSPLHSQKMGSFLAWVLSLITRLRKTNLVVKNIKGVNFELDLQQVIDSSLYYSETFEETEEQLIESILKPNMVVVDIGANFGYHTFRMANLVKPKGKVIAIEPTSWAYSKLLRNSNLNSEIDNIQFLNIGLSDRDQGEIRTKIKSSYRTDNKEINSTESITLKKLDTVILENHIKKLDFIKLDVDGYEVKVVRGAKKVLCDFRPLLLIEITPTLLENYGDNYYDLIQMLIKCNYTFFTTNKEPIKDIFSLCKHLPKNTSVMVFVIPATRTRVEIV